MKWNFISIKVRFELHNRIYSLVWSQREGFEVVRLDADVDRPCVVETIYSGDDIRDAANAVRGLAG